MPLAGETRLKTAWLRTDIAMGAAGFIHQKSFNGF